MVESDAVRKALGVVRIGEEMLHSAVNIPLESLAGFEFLPDEGQQMVAVDFKAILHGEVLLFDSKAFSDPCAEP